MIDWNKTKVEDVLVEVVEKINQYQMTELRTAENDQAAQHVARALQVLHLEALAHLFDALRSLSSRHADREQRGVRGTNKP